MAPVVVALVAAGPAVSACGVLEVSPPVDPEKLSADMVEAMIADGVEPLVAQCVVRVGRDDVGRGAISAVKRDELVSSCRRARSLLDQASTGSGDGSESGSGDEVDSLAFSDQPGTLGDDPVLDELWQACQDGSGEACDDLFLQSPLGSDYEAFGVTCGRRDELLNCRELDIDGDDEPVPSIYSQLSRQTNQSRGRTGFPG